MARKPKPSGRKGGYQQRRINIREPIQRFLIVCEGEKTEPFYFEGFRVPTVHIKIERMGKDPRTVVNRAITLYDPQTYDQVWCVFDRDDVLPELFNQAIELARSNGIEVAYSNQAFELWYWLHFNYSDVALSRSDYIEKLSKVLDRPYEKDDLDLYRKLLPKQDTAIQNGARLLSQYTPLNPIYDDPSTTVHNLVVELNRFTQKKRFTS
jgi:hypothetical protein